MTTEHDARTRTVVSWIREDGHENAERVLLAALNEIDHTQQRRSWWPAWRFSDMNTFAKVLVATVAVVAVAFVGINLLPGSQSGAGGSPPPASPSANSVGPSPSPSPSPTPEPTASPVARVFKPFAPAGVNGEEDPRAAAISFVFTAPPTWEPQGELGVGFDGHGPGDAYVGFHRGANLFSDPCRTAEEEAASVERIARGEQDGDVSVGPTVDDLVMALVNHPSLDVTDPVNVTLAGYSGRYLDLTVPDDISACANYRPMDPRHIYAQGPGQRWHMWILDVDGVRVLVETNDFPTTAPEQLAEEQAIIESLVITP
jgi:hypothetical protein